MYVLELAGHDDAFAACEAESAATGVELLGAGLATARAVTDRLDALAFTRRASALVGTTDPSVESAAALLRTAGVDRAGSVAVRAVDVRGTTGVDTQRVERALGDRLVDRGFRVDLDDPDHELRALFAGPPGSDGEVAVDPDSRVCALGWLTRAVEHSFGGQSCWHSGRSTIRTPLGMRLRFPVSPNEWTTMTRGTCAIISKNSGVSSSNSEPRAKATNSGKLD